MKYPALLLLIVLTFSHTGLAQQPAQAAFDEANTLYENGSFSEALTKYRTIESSGQVSGALYLNMGIVSVQLDSMGLAKYYFLKSADFETTRDRARKAVKYVNNQFSRQSAILPKLPWDRAIHWMNAVPGASGVFITGFILTLLGLIMLYLCWFEKLDLKKFSPYIITLILIGTTISLLAFYADYVDGRYDEAVLVKSQQRVLQSPNTESTLVSIAYEGYDLTVDHWKSEDQDHWLYIRLGNGQYGWIQSQGVKIL